MPLEIKIVRQDEDKFKYFKDLEESLAPGIYCLEWVDGCHLIAFITPNGTPNRWYNLDGEELDTEGCEFEERYRVIQCQILITPGTIGE